MRHSKKFTVIYKNKTIRDKSAFATSAFLKICELYFVCFLMYNKKFTYILNRNT